MIDNTSKQPENIELDIWKNFSDGVRKLLKMKNMKQIDLIEKSNLTRSTVNRICRNYNDNDYEYEQPNHKVFIAVCVGFRLTPDEKDKLYKVTYPEMESLNEVLEKSMDIVSAEDFLNERGCTLWEKQKREEKEYE